MGFRMPTSEWFLYSLARVGQSQAQRLLKYIMIETDELERLRFPLPVRLNSGSQAASIVKASHAQCVLCAIYSASLLLRPSANCRSTDAVSDSNMLSMHSTSTPQCSLQAHPILSPLCPPNNPPTNSLLPSPATPKTNTTCACTARAPST